MNADNRYRLLLQNILIAGAYWAISHINMLFFTSFGVLPMPIWPAASLALAVSLFMGLRGAPGIAAGALLSNALSLGSTFPVAAGIAVMNTLGPLAGALLIQRSAVMHPPFFRLRDTGLFLLYGVIVMAALTATGGIASILAGGRITLEEAPLSWLRWWIAHASGALLFTPMLLCWLSDRTLPALKEGLTCFGVCSVTLLLTAGVFFFINGSREPWSGLTYLLILPLVWGALHFKVRETMTLYLCMFLTAIIATVMGHGPFAGNQFPLLPLGEMAVGFGLTALLLCAVVSERSQTEEALKKNEATYRIVADNTYDWEFWLSPEERFIYLSPSCEKITGYSPREFEKDTGLLQHMIHPEDKEIFNQHRHSVCMTHAAAETEFRIIRRDGHIRWIHHVCQPVFDQDGLFLGTRGSNRDVTDNKLKESENIMLSSAVEHAAETVMVFDPEGIIHYVNTALLQLTGFSREEMVGQSAFPHDSMLEKYQQYREALAKIKQGEVWSGVVPIKRKNGTSYQSETTVSPIKNAANKPVSFVVIGRDITKERFMEEQLRQSQKMEAIGTLAGGIAHDFNNILGAIIGYTELSRDEVAEGTAVRSNLEQIFKASLRARDLIKQILAFSRKDMEEHKPVYLGLIIEEAVKLLRASLPSTIEILTHLDTASCMVQANAGHMQQLLMNLCTNAAQAMSENGGVMEITLKPVSLDEQHAARYPDISPGAYVQLTVSDTGSGIDPHIADRIFEPFFTTKEVGKGTGMGLAVVHGIVKSHGGAIQASSKQGKGSTFSVVLPRIREAQPKKPTEEVTQPLRGNERILFVDDEKGLIDIAQKQLGSLGYRVLATQSSSEALQFLQRDPGGFDLIITDQTMPHMTGDVLAQKCLQIKPDIPIILCTGYSEKVSDEKVRELGIRAFIMKPVNRSEIGETIRRVLDTGTPAKADIHDS